MNELDKRKEKIKLWLKNPYNLALIGIMLLAFIIRLYYFFLTKDQALWWDEAEYMLKARAIFKGTPLTGLAPFREVLIPYIWAFFYAVGNSEIMVRLLQVLISTFTVFMTYLVGKQLFDRRVGLVSALFISTFSIQLFFTNRILTYLWTPLIYLSVISLFLKGLEGKNKPLYLSASLLALGIVAYFNTIFLAFLLFIFLVFTEKTKLFKEKRWIVFFIVFILTLLPFLIYYFVTAGVPLPRFIQVQMVQDRTFDNKILPFAQWFGFIPQIIRSVGDPSYLGFPLFFFLLIGLYSLFEVVMSFDIFIKSKPAKLTNNFLLWLWILVPLVSLSAIIIILNSTDFYDAFLMPIFPGLAIASSLGFLFLYDYTKKYSPNIIKLFSAIIIVFALFTSLSYANGMILNKVSSYDSLKQAGLWLKENTNAGDNILTDALPEITYYSERATYPAPRTEDNMSAAINESHPLFFVLSAYEAPVMWSRDYAQRHPEKVTPVIGFPTNQNPTTIILWINQSAFNQ